MAALVAVAALGACGGDDDGEYRDDFRAVSQKLVSLGEDVGDAIETAASSTDEELAEQFEGFARRYGAVREELEGLEPPEDLARQQDELAEAIGAVRGSLADIAEAADRSDPDAARLATQQLVQRSDDLREARSTLARSANEL